MFYQCPSCKKVWQYPIKKCLDCLTDLKELDSEKAKVIGVSKNSITSLTHPKVPYFILVLEDENKNRWIQKSVKEYQIGEDFVLEPSKDKEAVVIWRVKYDVLEAVKKAIELLGGLKVEAVDKIMILPTLVLPKHPYFATNTNPGFLEATIRYLLSKGADVNNIKVAAQSFDEIPIEASAQKSQLLAVCQRYQIAPLDLAKSNFIKKEKDGLSFEISEEVFNSDLIINLPILKLDEKSGVRGAAENSLKFLKKESCLALQYLASQQELIEKVQSLLPGYLNLADSIAIQKKGGYTTFLSLTLASFNPFNLDRVFAEIAMIDNMPDHLKKIPVESIPVIGRQIKEVQYEFERW